MEEYRHLKLKLTPQRLAILHYLKDNITHPSAENIYRAVQKKFPTMSFATVYNTLEALKEKGKIRELKIDANKKRYDPDASPHHHFICNTCQMVTDVHKDFDLDLSGALPDDYDLTATNIEFKGLCPNCK